MRRLARRYFGDRPMNLGRRPVMFIWIIIPRK